MGWYRPIAGHCQIRGRVLRIWRGGGRGCCGRGCCGRRCLVTSLRATILEILLTLNTEFGISIIYITHDLTTAYQVGQNIIVLYQGAMVEAGDIELVIKNPRHPYTQLLVSSIPHPDPGKRWDEEEVVATAADAGGGRGQCLFVDRCPHAMDVCRDQSPPQFVVDSRRTAACFLYADTPTLEEGDLSRLMNSSVETAGPPQAQSS